MILRRLTNALRKQDWFTVLIETLIVVLGVFLGLQLGNWNAAHADRNREMQIVSDMLADIEIDRKQYANAMALSTRRIAAVTASLEGAGLPALSFEYDLPNADAVSYNFDILDRASTEILDPQHLWTNVVVGYFPTPSTSTYDAMVGSGEIRVMRNRELVRSIQLYRNLTESVATQNDKLISIRSDTMNIGAQYGLAPYLPVDPDAYYRLLADEPDLAAITRILATFTIFHYGENESADRQAALLQAQLETYLETTQ
ncbi:MAG: hypothetical protein WA989_17640 [Henriciella sp.]|uniref:hypothetical protein n=1 Tax=Henriciella sp. TaxID=1968823 RepID=UPI003C760E13